jgi:hypothetical protein
MNSGPVMHFITSSGWAVSPGEVLGELNDVERRHAPALSAGFIPLQRTNESTRSENSNRPGKQRGEAD